MIGNETIERDFFLALFVYSNNLSIFAKNHLAMKEKEIELGRYDTLSECLDAYDKLIEEGRNVFWGQYPEGYYVITEYIKEK